eukprot:3186066-Pyramimonas_sp.AAC.1
MLETAHHGSGTAPRHSTRESALTGSSAARQIGSKWRCGAKASARARLSPPALASRGSCSPRS